jgi:prepilin-type N-terminal cleavage/methylation domain-containing protein
MVRHQHGFTIFEILIGLSIVGLMAVLVIPGLGTVLNTQALKTKVSRLDAYVDKARNLAAVTECPVQMNLQPGSNSVAVGVQVQLDPFLKGCSAWYAQATDSNNRGFTGNIDDVRLSTAVSLRFSAVSGVLDNQGSGQLTLNYKNKLARISYQGIGNGVATYE